MDEPDIKQYCNYLEEAKTRLVAIQKFTDGGATIAELGREDFDIEFTAIQLRKVLELIAFSSLIENKKVYPETYKNFLKHWNPKYLLKDLEKINPNFYPKPVFIAGTDERGVKKVEFHEDGYLTQDDFIFLYDKCGKALHSVNPYGKPGVVNLKVSMSEWVQKITKLLYLHQVILLNTKDTWMVYLQYPKDNKVHAFPASPADVSELNKPSKKDALKRASS